MATRIEALGGVLRSWVTRLWILGGAAAAIYQFGCDQFDWPKLPALWGMTGFFVPWWGWLVVAQLGFTYGLFEYVRRVPVQFPPSPEGAPDTRSKQSVIDDNLMEMYKTLGQAVGAPDRLTYDLAMTGVEPYLLDLSRRNQIALPELRADGTPTGIYRALAFLNEVGAALRIDDLQESQKRAERIVPVLNTKSACDLHEEMGLPHHTMPPK